MTLVTLRPDSTVSSSGLAAGNPHTALSDNSNGTTVGAAGGSAATATMTLGTSTLPAGAVTKSLTGRLKAKASSLTPGAHKMRLTKADGTVLVDWYDQSWGSSLTTRSSSSVAWTGTQADVDGLRVWLHVNPKQANPYSIVAAEAYCDLRYVAQPTVTLDSAVVTLDSLAVGWTYSQPDSDGGAQSQWAVRVFTSAQYGAGGFNAATSTALAEASGTGTTNTATITGLPDGTLYKVYVRAADVVNGAALWSPWVASSTFSVTTTRAQVSAVAPTAQPSTASVSVAVTRDTGFDAWTGVDVERLSGVNLVESIGGMEGTPVAGVVGGFVSGLWNTPTSCVFSATTAAGRGQVQRIVATTVADAGGYVAAGNRPCVAGQQVDVIVDVNSAAWGNNAPFIAALFGNSAGGIISIPFGRPIQPAGWSTAAVSFTAPAGAITVNALVGVIAAAGTAGGAVTADLDALAVIVGGQWSPVAGSRFAASGNSKTVTDRLVTPDRPALWRARGVNAAGATGAWVYSTVASYTPTSLYLRDVAAPTNEILLSGWQPDGFPDDRREIPTAVLDVIGRTDPVVVWDVPKYRSGSFRVDVATLAESDELTALLDGRTLMILQPAILGPSMLIQPTGWTRERTAEQIATEGRYVTVDYIQVG